MTPLAPDDVATAWPQDGVLRVHFVPEALPHLGDEPGANRFDDPRPRTIDRFRIRYAANTLRGCLMELLASFRINTAADARVADVDIDDPDLIDIPDAPTWQHIADYLDGRKVATITHAGPATVSVNDPAVLADLDQEPAVRAVLDTDAAQAALLERDGVQVHLDNAAMRLSTAVGRYITQACALALYDRDNHPDAIHYRSRHDDTEHCWAIYDHATVQVGHIEPLSPDIVGHAEALNAVANLWDLPVPPAWQNRRLAGS